MVAESWFRGLWKPSRKHDFGPEKVRIGVLVFEVASAMSKLVHQWNSLADKQIMKLREEINNSVGIKKLVSDDENYVVDLICAEMLHNLDNVARFVTRLAKKCNDPLLKCFERAYDDLIKLGVDLYQWQFSLKKMNKKIKKMEKFIFLNANLYQEMETLMELEQILKRMMGSDDQDSITLVEYMKKVSCKEQEIKQLKEMSLWNKTHDYVVFLLARSIFTIFVRIGHVFGINHVLVPPKIEDSEEIYRSQSLSSLLQSSIHPSENKITRFSSGPLGNINNINNNNTKCDPISSSSISVSGSISIYSRNRNMNSFSGPIGNPTSKSGPLARATKTRLKSWLARDNSSKIHGKNINPNASCSTTLCRIEDSNDLQNPSSKKKIFDPPQGTLGDAALSLHYANIIVVLEKLVASPHLIGHDARDDLYNMLPKNIKSMLRERLKPYAKSFASSAYDSDLAEEWTEAMSGILEWLSPLAHNMIRWQSERSFEQQNIFSKTNVVLVQTLYYANQEKTEATITELLVGLNYVWRFSREVNSKALLECEKALDDSLSSSS